MRVVLAIAVMATAAPALALPPPDAVGVCQMHAFEAAFVSVCAALKTAYEAPPSPNYSANLQAAANAVIAANGGTGVQ